MDARVNKLIETLGLKPHPEGGYFVETFRSPLLVTPADARGQRSALTVIYFLLMHGACSRWHRVRSDEAWHWYEGSALELLTVRPEGGSICRVSLGSLSEGSAPSHVVPAGWWQAARPLGNYALVGCSVGPGFEFADFTLLSTIPETERPAFDPVSALLEFL
jgi:uncharacterized protein